MTPASWSVWIAHDQRWSDWLRTEVGARVRYLGEAPLIEDGSVRSDSTLLVNLATGYRFSERISAFLTVFNVLDAEDSGITYFYESQLPGEAAPVEDIHFHPVGPRTFRGIVTWRF